MEKQASMSKSEPVIRGYLLTKLVNGLISCHSVVINSVALRIKVEHFGEPCMHLRS